MQMRESKAKLGSFDPLAKSHCLSLQNIMTIVRKRQTIANMEKDMEKWVSSREKLSKRFEKLRKKRDALGAVESEMARDAEMEIDDQMETVKGESGDAVMEIKDHYGRTNV